MNEKRSNLDSNVMNNNFKQKWSKMNKIIDKN